MKLVKTTLIGMMVGGAVVLLLALTCPDEDSFDRWAKASLEPESGSFAAKTKGAALSTQAKWTADYEGHVLWATIDAYQGTTEYRFLGVMGTWFRIGEAESGG